jgi:hypothetical protein
MLSKHFKEFVALLNAHGVEYLVVGGYAMALHGRSAKRLSMRGSLYTSSGLKI